MLRAKTRCEMRLTCIDLEQSEPFEYDIRRFVTLKQNSKSYERKNGKSGEEDLWLAFLFEGDGFAFCWLGLEGL